MKVKKLIEQLSKMNPEAQVVIEVPCALVKEGQDGWFIFKKNLRVKLLMTSHTPARVYGVSIALPTPRLRR